MNVSIALSLDEAEMVAIALAHWDGWMGSRSASEDEELLISSSRSKLHKALSAVGLQSN